MNGQVTIYDWMPAAVPAPEWPECFRTCRHFEGHPEFPPDTFPGNRKKRRCRYQLHEGTSGKETKTVIGDDGTMHMYCKYYEYGGINDVDAG